MTEVHNSSPVLIALGSNLPSGGRSIRETLETAVALLPQAGLAVRARSAWFASPAFPAGNGPDYLNGAVLVHTALTPDAVLAALHGIEAALGRRRAVRWAPRSVDLDLLGIGDLVLPDPETVRMLMYLGPDAWRRAAPRTLILPHPRLHERGFVLAPLSTIAPDWRHPVAGRTVAEMYAALPPEMLEGVAPIA